MTQYDDTAAMVFLAITVGPLVIAMIVITITGLSGENAKLRAENRRLREWQGAQSQTPDLGAYRAQDIIHSPDAVLRGATEARARRMCGYCFITEAESCNHTSNPSPPMGHTTMIEEK